MKKFSNQEAFEKAFAREVLVSERMRVGIMLASLIFVAVFLLVASIFAAPTINALFRNRLPWNLVWGLLGIFLIYESAAFAMITFLIRTRRDPPFIVRFVSVWVEASLPSAMFILVLNVFEPAYVLSLPPLLFYSVFIVLAALRLDFWLCTFTGFVVAVEYLLLAWYVIQVSGNSSADPIMLNFIQHLGKAGLFLFTGVLAGVVSVRIKQQFTNSLRVIEERNQIISMFGQHVSPAVAEKLLAQPELELDGELRRVCVMFLDIRDFTAFAQNRSPEDVVHYLNTLFDFMIDSVNRHNGIINKFLGDGFMAVFGAPISNHDDVLNAVKAAHEILEKVEALTAAKGIPPTRVGIGLHAGDVVTGNVGSTLRKEYTVIGDTVNLASRIEQLNKQFASRLLISESVWQVIQAAYPVAEDLGLMDIRGHDQPLKIYKLA
jgi:adenylate cyclase